VAIALEQTIVVKGSQLRDDLLAIESRCEDHRIPESVLSLLNLTMLILRTDVRRQGLGTRERHGWVLSTQTPKLDLRATGPTCSIVYENKVELANATVYWESSARVDALQNSRERETFRGQTTEESLVFSRLKIHVEIVSKNANPDLRPINKDEMGTWVMGHRSTSVNTFNR
jgi:hypothetical protein